MIFGPVTSATATRLANGDVRLVGTNARGLVLLTFTGDPETIEIVLADEPSFRMSKALNELRRSEAQDL